jgi:hydroxyacylglutathione hydrolase
VIQTDAIKKLEDFANNNKQTQGKSTIGDEKVGATQRIFMQG